MAIDTSGLANERATLSPVDSAVKAAFTGLFDHAWLIQYAGCLDDWHGYARYLGLPHTGEDPDIPLRKLFVEPAVSGIHVAADASIDKWPKPQALIDALAETGRLVVLGDPGSGKSTLCDWLVREFSRSEGGPFVERFGARLPVPLILRELRLGPKSTWDDLLAEFLRRPVAAPLGGSPDKLLPFFERGQAILFADGLDELTNKETRQAVVAALQKFMDTYPLCLVVVTSRVVGYDETPLEYAKVDESVETLTALAGPAAVTLAGWAGVPPSITNWVGAGAAITAEMVREQLLPRVNYRVAKRYLMPFDNERIRKFLENWFRERHATEATESIALQLWSALRGHSSLAGLARTPNLLTLIALVYRARRKLPQGRTMLFSLIAEAYLDSIDQARGIQATPYSYDQQRHWLSLIAFRMQQRRAKSIGESGESEKTPETAILVPRQELQQWLTEAMKSSLEALGLKIDANEEAAKYLKVVARRSGLLLPRGQAGNDNLYAFQHLSLQDYFASQFIMENVLRPRWIDGHAKAASLQPNDVRELASKPTWRETFVLLFESLAKHPGWSETLLELIWPPGKWYTAPPPASEWESNERMIEIYELIRDGYQLARLLAEVAANVYSGLLEDSRRVAFEEAWRWEFEVGMSDELPIPFSNSGALLDGEQFAMSVLLEQWIKWNRTKFYISSFQGTTLNGLHSLFASEKFRPLSVVISGSENLQEIDALLEIPSLRSIVLERLPSLDVETSFRRVRPSIKSLFLFYMHYESLQFAVDCPYLESLYIVGLDHELSVRPLLECPQLQSLVLFSYRLISDLDVLSARTELTINDTPVAEAIATWRQKRESLPATAMSEWMLRTTTNTKSRHSAQPSPSARR